MEHIFQIRMGDKSVGTADVQQEGLYYRIRCRCNISKAEPCRVLVRCGQQEESLGILVPMGEDFCLDTRIPMKKLGGGQLSFLVAPKRQMDEGIFVPLSPEEPFRYIARLKDAYLDRKNGKIGVIIKEPGCG